MHHLILAFQPGDQRRTDEAAGAEYVKVEWPADTVMCTETFCPGSASTRAG